jgi:hypothetical protein
MTIQRGSGLVVDERTDLSRGANDNVIFTDVGRRGETMMRIVNFSIKKPRNLETEIDRHGS